MTKPPIPRETVAEIARNFRELMALKDREKATQAQLIRWCLLALTQTTDQIHRRLERKQQHVYLHEPAKVQRQERNQALACLAWLADKLEGKDVPDLKL